MQQTIIFALLDKAALLLVLSVIYEFTSLIFPRARLKQAISGLCIALMSIAILAMPIELKPGILFDTRSVLISVTALSFGHVPTVAAVIAAAVFRVYLGGAGTLAGIAIILSSAVIGLVWRRWLSAKNAKRRWLIVYAMSVVLHITMLASTFLLPASDRGYVVREVALPVLLIYPVVSVLLDLLLNQQQILGQMRDRLKQSEERFRQLFDKALLGYHSLDTEGKIIDVNQRWLDTFGYTRDEVIGKHFTDFLHPSYKANFLRSFTQFEKPGKRHDEFEMIHKNGEAIYIAFDSSIDYDDNGDPKLAHCILRDITEQKKAETGLRESELKYRRLYETMAQGVVYQSADGAILSANPAAERILGLPHDQMVGKTSQDTGWKTIREDGSELPGSEHPSMITLRTGRPYGPIVLGVFQPQLNNHVWLSVNAIPIFEPDGTLSQVYTTFQDVTAEKTAKQDYQFLFNAMVDGFALHEIICDPLGKPINYRFLAVNSAFEQMTGLKASDIVGRTVLETMPDTEPYWIETYGKVALTGQSIMFENYSASTDKYFRVMAYQPAPMQFACTFSDDTMRVQAISRLRGLLDNSNSPIIVFDDKGKIVEISVIAEKIIGLSKDQLSNIGMDQLGMAEVYAKALALSKNPFPEERIIESMDVFEIDGETRYFESRVFQINTKNTGSELFGYIGIDVTARIVAEQALQESEEKHSSYIENAPYAVFVVDENGNYLESNRAASLITGYSREQILHMNIRSMTAAESMEEAISLFQAMSVTGKMSAELKYIHSSGSVRWWTIDAVKITDNRFLGFSIDITDRKQAEADLIDSNRHDYLTGIYNRRFYETELARLDVEELLPLSVIIGDINGVKLINDAFGHAEGDKLIAESAMIIKNCCREGDIVARLGGDEFGVLLPKTDNEAAFQILQKIQAALEDFATISKSEMYQHSVALGCATKVSVEEDIKEILKVAEGYMYQRKLLEHNSTHSTIISSIKATMFEKSHETEEHAERLVNLSKAVGLALHLSHVELDKLELLSALHDIGKVAIRDEVLTKPGALTESEWVEMRRHPEIGYRIAMTSPELVAIAEGILCHHEWWNGGGYPRGLYGDSIPLIARIVAVSDAYDAMTNDRPYRTALEHKEAIRRIQDNAGTQFDPEVARIFIESVS